MSETLFSFGINSEEIQSVFGSKNNTLLKQVLATNSFKAYKDFLPAGFKLSTEQAIRQLFYGESLNNNDYHAYGYALICICEALGDTLPYNYEFEQTEDIQATTIPIINALLANQFNIGLSIETLLLAENKHPFSIPTIQTFPKIGFVNKADLPSILQKLAAISIENDMIETLAENEPEKSLAYQNIQALKNNIEDCIEFEYDYISFFH